MNVRSDPPTPQERDERIAELRRQRRARMRYLAVRGGLATAALAVLAVALLYWLLTTIAGRDVLLAQIVARLPADATLTWRQAEGPARGPLTLRGVRFSYHGTQFTARRVMLDPALRPLLGRRLRLDALQIEQATLELPESDEPFELPRWPGSLPQIAPPMALRADDVRVDGLRVTRARAPLIDIRRLRGGIDARSGKLRIERWVIDSDRGRFTVHGQYAPAKDYRTDLVATAVLPAPARRTRPRLGLVARGNLARMDVGLAGAAPGPLRASLTLRGRDEPHWRLRADASALDPGQLSGRGAAPTDTPLVLRLQADGVGGNAQLQGQLRRGDLAVRVLPSTLRLADQVLQVQPLALELLEGTATLRGQADFRDPQRRNFRFAIAARGLTWGGGEAPAIVADAAFDWAGTVEAWTAAGTAELTRDGDAAQLRFDARGDAERLRLRTLEAKMPTGTLIATGEVVWAPASGWDIDATLAGFDPGYFVSGWDGAISGRIASQAVTREDGGFDILLDAPQLRGRLRGRPLDGRARLAISGPAPGLTLSAYDGEVALTIGGSRIDARGRVTDTLDIDARFAPLHLGDLLPDAAGTLRGTLALTGARAAPDVAADLDGTGLSYRNYRADSFSAQGKLPWRGGGGVLAVRATGLQAGVAFDTLRVDARGAVESLTLDAEARGDTGALSISGDATRRGSVWQGTLASLQLVPARGAQWVLQQPTAYRWDGRNGSFSRACLAPRPALSPAEGGGGALCASADWPRRGLDVEGRGLPLALAEAYLPERDDGLPLRQGSGQALRQGSGQALRQGSGQAWLLRGEVALDVTIRPVGNAWRGQAMLRSDRGGLRFSDRARRDLIGYEDLSLDATFDPRRLQAELRAALAGGGRFDARIATGWDAYAPLIGQVEVATDQLTWLELFSPDIVEPQGRLEGRIGLSGTRAQPLIDGRAQLSGFTAEVPSLAIVLRDGSLRFDALPDGTARIEGSVATQSGSEGGVLRVDGSLGWRGGDTPLLLNLRGDDVLVSDTRDLRAVASPDVRVRYAPGQPLSVTGTVGVPSARIDLERLDRGVSSSPDVVVLDPVDPQRSGTATALEMDLTLALGEDVELHGFGLDGSLDGNLRVRSVPGREMTASGRLEVSGEYVAYGQELRITRGYLSWSNGPVADPVLDIRAERVVGEVTAGVDVDGRASSPQARVWSNPATSQSEALALLALGRPLATASSDERGQVSAASAALSAGGGLLASQLGARIGLDDAGVMRSRALGSDVLGVGKFLSPRLYVGYGVSLLGTGQVLTLKYLIGRGFDIEIESSTIENRGSINWRIEK